MSVMTIPTKGPGSVRLAGVVIRSSIGRFVNMFQRNRRRRDLRPFLSIGFGCNLMTLDAEGFQIGEHGLQKAWLWIYAPLFRPSTVKRRNRGAAYKEVAIRHGWHQFL